jgi:NAD(P)-dependent dehydrogenase (short-subunit alcohol dehydrogenase family)
LGDKIALITGATGGIGAGIARLFAAEGATVLVHGRYAHEEAGIMGLLESDGIPRERLAFRDAELTDPEQCKALIGSADQLFGGLDLLINNAGDFRRGGIDTTTLDLWDAQFGVNVRAPFILAQAAVPLMRRRGGGSIVNIGSINAYIGQPNLLAYSSSKGALTTFTKNLASQVNVDNIRVNQVNPGWTLTETEDRVQREESGRDDWLGDALTTRPFGCLLEPRDIALAALYFASDDSRLVTGSVLDVEQFPITGPLGWGKKA